MQINSLKMLRFKHFLFSLSSEEENGCPMYKPQIYIDHDYQKGWTLHSIWLTASSTCLCAHFESLRINPCIFYRRPDDVQKSAIVRRYSFVWSISLRQTENILFYWRWSRRFDWKAQRKPANHYTIQKEIAFRENRKTLEETSDRTLSPLLSRCSIKATKYSMSD